TCLDGTTLDPPTGPIKCVGGGDAGAPVVDAGREASPDAADARPDAAPEAAAEPDAESVEIPVDGATSPSAPMARQHPSISDVEGGCSCRMAERDRRAGSGTWIGAALLACASARRRSARRQRSI